jgi:histidine triad (HIT) family protein
MASKTLFEKIAAGEIPSSKVWENDKIYAFRDLSPTAPVHVLIVPKVCGRLDALSSAAEDDKEILGELLYAASLVAKELNLGKG